MTGLKTFSAGAVISLLLVSCDSASKRFEGRYYLDRFSEDNSYCVVDFKHNADAGGVFSGNVLELGSNKDWILACVRKNVSDPFRENRGWYALSLKDGRIVGPIPENELHTDPVWSSIKINDPAAIFAGL